MAAIDFADVVNSDQIVVLEPRGRVRFRFETIDHPPLSDLSHVAHAVGPNNFQSNQSICCFLTSFVNNSHPPLPERTDQFVIAERLP